MAKKKKKDKKQKESRKDAFFPPADSTPLFWIFTVILLIFAATFGVYWNTLDNEFLTFDDRKYIYENTLVTGDGGIGAIWADLFNEKPKLHYYPLTFTTFWLEHKLVGLSPPDANISEAVNLPAHPLYHMNQMILHSLNALLVLLTLRALGIGFPVAAFTAIFFAIHPVNVASVAWMAERKNMVSGFFFWLTLLLYIHHLRDKSKSKGPGRQKIQWFYICSLCTYLLALSAKGATVVLAPIIMITDRLLDRRWSWTSVQRAIPFFFFAVLFGLDTAAREALLAKHWQSIDPWLRPFIAISAIIHYLAKMLLPFKQAIIYPRWPETIFTLRYWLSLAVFTAAIVLIWKKRKWLGDHWIWAMSLFLISVFPVLGLKYFAWNQLSFVSDHYVYYGSPAIIMMVGILLAKWVGISELSTYRVDAENLPPNKKKIIIVATCILIALSVCWVRTVQQNRTWKNNVTLWEHTLKINPDSFIANRNLGNHYSRNGDYERALAYYKELTRVYPDFAISWHTSARAARKLRRTDEAIGYYKHAIYVVEQLNPRSWKIRTEYADYLNAIGHISEAVIEYQAIIEKQPPNIKKLEEKVQSLRMRLKETGH